VGIRETLKRRRRSSEWLMNSEEEVRLAKLRRIAELKAEIEKLEKELEEEELEEEEDDFEELEDISGGMI